MKLHSILMPPMEYDHVEKGDALYGMSGSNLVYGLVSINL